MANALARGGMAVAGTRSQELTAARQVAPPPSRLVNGQLSTTAVHSTPAGTSCSRITPRGKTHGRR
nr:hypothetical protein [Actinophytocola xanthii]